MRYIMMAISLIISFFFLSSPGADLVSNMYIDGSLQFCNTENETCGFDFISYSISTRDSNLEILLNDSVFISDTTATLLKYIIESYYILSKNSILDTVLVHKFDSVFIRNSSVQKINFFENNIHYEFSTDSFSM